MQDWIEHRRGRDGELVGWMRPDGEGFVAIDVLGRERTGVVDWLAAEEALDEAGLRELAEPFELLLDGGEWLRVRLVEVSPSGITVKKDDWATNAVGAEQMFYTLGWPMPDTLRPVAR